MFEKILKKENGDMTEPDLGDREGFLRQIRKDNCNEIIRINISLKVLEQDEIFYPEMKNEIATQKERWRRQKKDLIMGIEFIDKELNEIAKGAKK